MRSYQYIIGFNGKAYKDSCAGLFVYSILGDFRRYLGFISENYGEGRYMLWDSVGNFYREIHVNDPLWQGLTVEEVHRRMSDLLYNLKEQQKEQT